MARGLFAGRSAVGSKFRKMKEEKGKMAKLRPELAPTSPERKLVKSPIEKMVPEGSAKMVAVRPEVTQVAQDVQAPTERGQIMGAAAPAAIQAQGAVAVAKDKPVSREVARGAAMNEIRAEVAAETKAAAPVVGEAAVTAPQRVATTQAPAQGQVLGGTTQRQGITKEEAYRRQPKMREYEKQYGKGRATKVGGRYIAEKAKEQLGGWGEFIGGMGKATKKALMGQADGKKSKRWWGGRFA